MQTSVRSAHTPVRPPNRLEDGLLRSDLGEAALCVLAWLLVCLLAGWCAPAAAQRVTPAAGTTAPTGARTYVVSVVPQFPATEINRMWAPLLERLGQDTGVRFELRVARDIPSFEAELRAGDADFVYLNPYHQLVANQLHGYLPLVRDSEPLSGLIVVRRDSPLRNPRELQGQTLAFPAPNAFGASMLVRAMLSEQDGVQIRPQYARTHSNSYRLVAAGQVSAAGGLRATLEREPEALRAQLRVLAETSSSAPHPLSVHPRVPTALRLAVQRAWLQMAQDSTMLALMKDLPMPHPVTADHERDYAPLARLHLDRYVE